MMDSTYGIIEQGAAQEDGGRGDLKKGGLEKPLFAGREDHDDQDPVQCLRGHPSLGITKFKWPQAEVMRAPTKETLSRVVEIPGMSSPGPTLAAHIPNGRRFHDVPCESRHKLEQLNYGIQHRVMPIENPLLLPRFLYRLLC